MVRKSARILLDYATIDSVRAKADTLKILAGTGFWDRPTISDLEKYRDEVRDLMQYIRPQDKPVDIDTIDETLEGEYHGNGLMDIRTYKEKVIDYLAENTNNPTIQKIRNLEPINANDLKELERVLWEELGTKDEYQKITNIDNLAAFIRSIVGIEQDAINEKFGEFLSGNTFNSQQQEFVKSIIDYVRENGDIEAEDLIEKSPFDGYDIITMFGTQAQILRNIVDIMHNSITAA